MATTEELISINCPSCNHPLKVESKPTPRTVSFVCTNCGDSVKVNVPPEIKNCGKRVRVNASPAIEGTILPGQASTANKKTLQKTVYSDAFDPSWTVAPTRPPQAVLRITMHRRVLPAAVKAFSLEGFHTWTIGRSDSATRSDIEITGDSSVSRRSVTIEAIRDRNGASFLLKVINSRNPIYINGRALGNGESIQLCFGDRITMGKTTMTFSDK